VPVFVPTFGNPPPEQPLRYPAENSRSANAPTGISRRVVRLPNLATVSENSAAIAAKEISHIVCTGAPGLDGVGIVSAEPRTVVVNVITVLVPALTDAGLNDAVVAVGNPLAENATVPGNAPPTAAVPIV
jgi:hypothetical protein